MDLDVPKGYSPCWLDESPPKPEEPKAQKPPPTASRTESPSSGARGRSVNPGCRRCPGRAAEDTSVWRAEAHGHHDGPPAQEPLLHGQPAWDLG